MPRTMRLVTSNWFATWPRHLLAAVTARQTGRGERAGAAAVGVPKSTLHPTTQPPAGKSNVSNKPSRNGSKPNPAPTTSTNSRRSSTNSSTPTTTTAPTDPSDVQPQQPPTPDYPKPVLNTTVPTSTSESATTASTKQAPSHSATTADSTTSASAEPTNTPP